MELKRQIRPYTPVTLENHTRFQTKMLLLSLALLSSSLVVVVVVVVVVLVVVVVVVTGAEVLSLLSIY